jgi:DNA-binding NarL/FixJ family response regulator
MMRVLIADGCDVVRQGIRQVLEAEPAIAVCGEARDGEELVAKAQALQPAVVVVDVELPKMNGIEATGRILDGRLYRAPEKPARLMDCAKRAVEML